MNLKWLSVAEDKEKIEKRLKECRDVLEMLNTILDSEYQSTVKAGEDKKNYWMPAWKEFQADNIATRRTLRKVMNLLIIEE